MSKKQTAHFYKNLVPFLIGAYPRIDTNKAERLGLCAFGYFQSLLMIDNVIDEKMNKNESAKKIFEAFALNETAVKELAFLIPEGHEFWQQFENLKKQYAGTVFWEKELSAKKADFTEEMFEKLAFGKSSICCGIVFGLQAIGNSPAPIDTLNGILKHVHIAFQYLDDIVDFKEDSINRQWTYSQFLIQEYFKTNQINIEDVAVKYKYLFLSGIAQTLIEKAISEYQIAIDLAQKIELNALVGYLKKEKSNAQFYLNEVNLLIEKAQIKSGKSQSVKLKKQHITNILNDGLKYLISNEKDGYWSDFMTSAGHGKSWISGYVGLMLAENIPELPILKTISTNLSTSGAYNENSLQDADSSTFVLGFKSLLNDSIQEDAIKQWLKFHQNDGGWATYIDANSLKSTLELDESISVEGWQMSHPCVSAAAAYTLSFMPSNYAYFRQKTCDYLSKLIQNEQLNSYWWTSDVYAEAFTLLALGRQRKYMKECELLSQKIIARQHSNGYWLNPIDNTASAFYTAIALKALLADGLNGHKNNIELGANWLIKNQMTDGSWSTSRILRIPATNVKEPQKIKEWRQSSFGVNALSDDHNRVFTTSTVVNFLHSFQRL